MGKKTIDIKRQCNASQGRKLKAGGGIKSDSIIYTPEKKYHITDLAMDPCEDASKQALQRTNVLEDEACNGQFAYSHRTDGRT